MFLSGVMGLTLPRVGDLIGRSGHGCSFPSEFREWLPGRQDKEISWGGRRRAYLTFEEEKEFSLGFFEVASRGGIVVVSEVALLLKRGSSIKWPRRPYTGCWKDMVGGK